MLYLSYQAQVMDSTTKDSKRLEICNSLKSIFKRILCSEDSKNQKESWDFSQVEEASHFWKKFEDIYRALLKWSKSQKGKERLVSYDLMAMMLGHHGAFSLREKYSEELIRSIVTQHQSMESHRIIRDYLRNLRLYEDKENIPSTFENQLTLISENILPKITEIPKTISLFIDVGVEIGLHNIHLGMNIVRTILTLEYAPEYKTASLIILTELARQSYTNFSSNLYHTKLYEPIAQLFDNISTIVIQRDKEFLDRELLTTSTPIETTNITINTTNNEINEDSSSSQSQTSSSPNTKLINQEESFDHNEMLLSATLQALSHIEAPLEKQVSFIEKIAQLSVSPVFDIAETSLFCLRDILLINPAQHLIHILTLILNHMTNYFCKTEDHIKRCLYNLSVLLYYFNQAIGMDFEFDGLSIQKFILLRYRIEGTLLVWLCSTNTFIYSSVWKIMEQLTTPQIRQLELTCEQITPSGYLIDFLPRNKKRNITFGGDSILIELPGILDKNYLQIFFSLNWAWSNLYEIALHSEELMTQMNGINKWSNYFRLLCIIPRHPPEQVSFEEKSHYLSKGVIGRLFQQIANMLHNQSFDKNNLNGTTEALKVLHPSCYDDLILAIKNTEQNQNQSQSQNQQNLSPKSPKSSPSSISPHSSQDNLLLSPSNNNNNLSAPSSPSSTQRGSGSQSSSSSSSPMIIFSLRKHVLSLFRQFLINMNSETYFSSTNKISSHFKEICKKWFDPIHFTNIYNNNTILSFISKRDMIIILERCIFFQQSVTDFLLPNLNQEYPDIHSQIIFLIEFTDKLIHGDESLFISNDGFSPSLIACYCAQIQLVTTLLSLHKIDAHIGVFEVLEKELIRICSRGDFLQEFNDQLFLTYITQNPQRLQNLIQHAIQNSPSITEKKKKTQKSSSSSSSSSNYALSIPILRAIITILSDNYLFYIQLSSSTSTSSNTLLFFLFFTSLYFQCSFEIVERSLAIDLALIISNRESQVHTDSTLIRLNHSGGGKRPKPSLSMTKKSISPRKKLSPLGQGSFDKIPLKELEYLHASDFLPCASSIKRDIYITNTKQYCIEIAKEYDSHSRDALRIFDQFIENISYATDISLMISLACAPWAKNYATCVKNPPRWIIRAVYDISYKYTKNHALIIPIQSLWEEIVKTDPMNVAKMGLEWLIEYCTEELKQQNEKQLHDDHSLRVCSLAAFSIIRSCPLNQRSILVQNYLILKLRTYLSSQSNKLSCDNIFKFKEWLNNHFSSFLNTTQSTSTSATSSNASPSSTNSSSTSDTIQQFSEYREHAVLLFLCPLIIGDIDFEYSNFLPLILQHSFVSNYSFYSNDHSLGFFLISNMLQGIQIKLSNYKQKRQKSSDFNSIQQRFSIIRENYFPDSASLLVDDYSSLFKDDQEKQISNVSDFIFLTSSKQINDRQKLNSSNTLTSTIPYKKISRLVNILEYAL